MYTNQNRDDQGQIYSETCL